MDKFKIIIEKLKYATIGFLFTGYILNKINADFIFPGNTYLIIGFLCLVIYCVAKLFGKHNVSENLKYVGGIIFSLGFFLAFYQVDFVFTAGTYTIVGFVAILVYCIAKIFGK